MIIKVRNVLAILLLLVLIILSVLGMRYGINSIYKKSFPLNYSEYVEETANKYSLDKYFIYAVIKTESNFNKNAVSNVGARGLMQIMTDTFEWIKFRLSDEKSNFDDMFNSKQNINYGVFLLSFLMDEFKTEETSLAAYHAGRTAVSNWLKDDSMSKDGVNLENIPINDTAHYVQKVMDNYKAYKKLYDKEK